LNEDSTRIEKTTILKSAEPLKIKIQPFANHTKMEVTIQADPNNPIHMDQFELSVADSNTKRYIAKVKEYFEKEHGCIFKRDDEFLTPAKETKK